MNPQNQMVDTISSSGVYVRCAPCECDKGFTK